MTTENKDDKPEPVHVEAPNYPLPKWDKAKKLEPTGPVRELKPGTGEKDAGQKRIK
jgi:hypothetical protein